MLWPRLRPSWLPLSRVGDDQGLSWQLQLISNMQAVLEVMHALQAD